MTKHLNPLLFSVCVTVTVGCNSERQSADQTIARQSSADALPSTDAQTRAQARSAKDRLPTEKGNRVASKSATRQPQVPEVDIFAAAATGDLVAIKQHLEVGTDFNAKEPVAGGTPLIAAAVFGQTEAVKLLIESGAGLAATNSDGATALHTAAFFAHPEIVKLLLKSGAKVNAKNVRGETPLDTVAAEWNDQLRGVYQTIASILNLKLDLKRIEAARPIVAELLRENGGQQR